MNELNATPSANPSGLESLPAAFDRVNWAAVFLGGWYALAQGLWLWLAALVGLDIATVILFVYVNRIPTLNPVVWGSLFFVTQLLSWGLVAAFGLRANLELWKRGSLRSSAQIRAQRPWAILGLVLTIVSFGSTLWITWHRAPARLFPLVALYGLTIALLVALWWYDRRKRTVEQDMPADIGEPVQMTSQADVSAADSARIRVLWLIGVFLVWPLLASAIEGALITLADAVPSVPWSGQEPDITTLFDIGQEAVSFVYIVALLVAAFLVALLLIRVFKAPRGIWGAMTASGVLSVLASVVALIALATGFTQSFLVSGLVTGGMTDIPVPLIEQLPEFFTSVVGPALAVLVGSWIGAAVASRRRATAP